MSKKKPNNYSQNLVNALNKLPSAIYDKKHDLTIYLNDTKARSNQSRFQHIARNFHDLNVNDIKSIPKGITNNSTFKKNKVRKDTFNYYFEKKQGERKYIKISVLVDFKNKIAVVKSVFKTGKKK